MEHRLVFLVAEIDIIHADIARERRICERAVAMRMLPCPFARALGCLCYIAFFIVSAVYKSNISVVCLGLFIHEGEYALRTCHTHDDGVYLLGKLVYIAGELLCHIEKRNDDGNSEGERGKAAFLYETVKAEVCHVERDEKTACHGTDDIKDISYIHDDGTEDIGIGMCLFAVFIELFVYRVKILFSFALVAEYLDYLLPVHHLLYVAFAFCDGLLIADEVFCASAAYLFGDEYHCHHAEHYHERHRDTVPHHDAEYRQHYDAGLEHLRE